MSNVIDVAQYILDKIGATSTWKLQKLVYYSQAWHSVWHDKTLFSAQIEAWANGPVCRKLYDQHQGKFTIKNIVGGDGSRLKEKEKQTIDAVVTFYGKYNGQQLSDLTHSEEPWKKARIGMGLAERGNAEISLESMNEYYSSLKSA